MTSWNPLELGNKCTVVAEFVGAEPTGRTALDTGRDVSQLEQALVSDVVPPLLRLGYTLEEVDKYLEVGKEWEPGVGDFTSPLRLTYASTGVADLLPPLAFVSPVAMWPLWPTREEVDASELGALAPWVRELRRRLEPAVVSSIPMMRFRYRPESALTIWDAHEHKFGGAGPNPRFLHDWSTLNISAEGITAQFGFDVQSEPKVSGAGMLMSQIPIAGQLKDLASSLSVESSSHQWTTVVPTESIVRIDLRHHNHPKVRRMRHDTPEDEQLYRERGFGYFMELEIDVWFHDGWRLCRMTFGTREGQRNERFAVDAAEYLVKVVAYHRQQALTAIGSPASAELDPLIQSGPSWSNHELTKTISRTSVRRTATADFPGARPFSVRVGADPD